MHVRRDMSIQWRDRTPTKNRGGNLDELAEAYFEVRREMWKTLAERVGEEWQLMDSQVRYQVVLQRIADLE